MNYEQTFNEALKLGFTSQQAIFFARMKLHLRHETQEYVDRKMLHHNQPKPVEKRIERRNRSRIVLNILISFAFVWIVFGIGFCLNAARHTA